VFFIAVESCFGSDACCTLAGGATRGVEGQETLAQADDLIAGVEMGDYDGVGFR